MSSGPGIASKDRENVVANTTSTTKNRDKDSISSAAASSKDNKTSNFTTLNINSLYRGKSIETSKAPGKSKCDQRRQPLLIVSYNTVQKHGMQSLGKVGNIRRLAAPNSSQSSSLSILKSQPESGQENDNNSKLVESVSGGADTTTTTNINTSSSWTNQPQQQNTNSTSVNNKPRDSAKSTQDSTSLSKQGSGGISSQYPQSGGGGTRWISPAVGPASAFPPLGAEHPPAVPSPKQHLVTTNPLRLPPTEFPELGAEPLPKEDPTKGSGTGQVERSQGLPPPISIPTAPASQREQETPAYGPGPSLRPSVKWSQGAAPPVANGQLPINSADPTRAFAGLPPPTLNAGLLPTRGPQYSSSQRSGYHGGGGDGGTQSPKLSRTGKGGKENESAPSQPPKFSSANIIPSEKISAFDEILEKGGELKIDWTTACCEIDYEEDLKFDLDDGESLFSTKKPLPKPVTSTATSSNTTISKSGPERERTISETSNGTQGGRGGPRRHASFEDEVTRGQLNPSHRVLYDPRDGKQKPTLSGGRPRRDSRSTSERSDEDVSYQKNQIGGGKHGEVPRSQGLPPPPGVVPFTTNVMNEPRNRTIAPRFQKSQQQIPPRYDTGPNQPLNRNPPNDGRGLKESQGISGQGQQNQNERRTTLSRAEEDTNWRVSRNKPKPDDSSTRKLSIGDKESSTTGNVVREILKPESRVESAKNTEKQQPSNDQQQSHNMTTLGTRKLSSQQQQGENLTQSRNNNKSRADDSSSRKWNDDNGNQARRSSNDSGHSGSTEKKTDGPFSSISADTLKQPEKPTNTTPSVPPGLSKDSTVPPARIVIGLHGSTTGPVRTNNSSSGAVRVIPTSNYGPPPSTAAFANVQPVKPTNQGLLDDSSKPLGSSNRDGERGGPNQQPRSHNREHDYPIRDQDRRQYQHRDNDSRYRDDRRQNQQPRNENKQTSSSQQNRPQPPSLSEARSAKSPDDDEYETASESSHKDLDVRTDGKSQNRLQQDGSKGNNNRRQLNNNDRPRDDRKQGPNSRPSDERRRREGAESNRQDDRTRNDRQKKPDERRKQDAVKDIVNSLNEVSLSEKNSVTGLKKDFNSLSISEKKEDYDLTDGHKRRPKEVEDATTADSKKLKQEVS